MRSHRKLLWQAPKHKPEFDTFSDTAPMPSIFQTFSYPQSIFVERTDEKDEDGGPLVLVWYSLGNDIFAMISLNREDAQTLVTSLREAFPPELGLITDFPGVR